MGVPGLWDIVHPAGRTRSIAHVATEAFRENTSGKRGYRIGIDASIWYKHASFNKHGEKPELRFLFFKLAKLTRLPLIPLFVFDGRERPKVKRGSRMGKAGSHALTAGFKKLLDLFGMEWRMALGEAEAELAWLNRQGVIDAIISDDVDTLVFGAVNTMKNSSLLLSSNKSKPALDSKGKRSADHAWTYNAHDIHNNPAVCLSRAGLILIALLSGGDYSEGVSKFGPAFAYGLARCGFGEDLVRIYEQRASRDVRPLLSEWRDRASLELQTNSRGFLSRRSTTLVIPYDFPDFKVMENYINPVTSERQGRAGGGTIRDSKVMSIPRLAAFCEAHFGDWGYEDEIVKRFRTILWESAVIFLLRHAALEADERQKRRRNMLGANIPAPAATSDEVGTPLSFIRRHLESFELSTNDRIAAAFVNRGPQPDPQANQTVEDKNPLRMQIVGSRQHVSTDHTLEYRVEFIPSIFVEMTRKACKLKEPSRPNNHTPEVEDEWNVLYDGTAKTKKKGPQKPPPPPDSAVRMWVPSVMMETAHPSLVEAFKAVEAARRSGKGKGKSRGPAQPLDCLDDASEEEEDMTDLDDTLKFNDGHAGPDFQPRSIPSTFAPIAGSTHIPPHTFMDPRPSQVDPRASALNADLHSSDTVIGHSDPARPPSGFLFWFPNPDDPDMLVLEDGLELPPIARPSLKPAASPRPSREVAMQSVERQPRNIWDDVYDQVMPVGLGSSQTRPKQTRTPKKTSSSQSQRARQPEQRVPEPAPDFAALFAEPEDELPVRRNAFDDVFDQVFVPRSQRPKKTTKTARTNPSLQAQRTAPVPPRHRTHEPAPAPDHSAGEVPAWSSGRQNAFDTDLNQDYVPRLERPAKTAPAPRSNPSSQAHPRQQRADLRQPQGPAEPALDHAAQFAPPEDVDPEPPRDVYDNVFEQVFWPRSHKAKPRPTKRPVIGSSTNGGAPNRPAKRPRTTDAGLVAGSSTVTRSTSSQPAHSAPAARFDSDVIEIESDDDDTAPKPTQRPSGHPDTQPGHGREFIDDDVIDLT